MILQAIFKYFQFSGRSRDLQQPLSKLFGCVSLFDLKIGCRGLCSSTREYKIVFVLDMSAIGYSWHYHYWEILGKYCKCRPWQVPERTSPFRTSQWCPKCLGLSLRDPLQQSLVEVAWDLGRWDVI